MILKKNSLKGKTLYVYLKDKKNLLYKYSIV